MDRQEGFLPEEQYVDFLAHMPEVCVDLVVESERGVLLAERTNEPAKGEWFWPGSRLFKGERLGDAVGRVADRELGIEPAGVERLGVSEHFWGRSAQAADVSRHTVVVVHHVTPASSDPGVALDDQHAGYRWVTEPDPGMNEYVSEYFERFDLPRRH